MPLPQLTRAVPAIALAIAACADPGSPPALAARLADSVTVSGVVRDLAYDPVRDLLYLSHQDSSRIAILDLDRLTYDQPLVLPFKPLGIDLSATGDSLFIASAMLGVIAIADVSGQAPAMEMHHLERADSLEMHPVSVKVLSSGHALMALTDPRYISGCGAGRMLLLHLPTGAEEVRTGLDCVTEDVKLVRAANRSRALMLIDDSCCPTLARVYDAAASSFTPSTGTVDQYGPSVSASSDGNRFLVGNVVLDYAADTLSSDTLFIRDTMAHPTTLAPDGQTAFLSAEGQLREVRLSDRATLWSLALPGGVYRLFALPGRRALLAFTIPRIYVIEW